MRKGTVLHPIAIVVAAVAAVSCGGPSAPSAADALSQSSSSAFVDFSFSSGDAVDAARQDAFHTWVIAQLGITPAFRIHYNKYRDIGHIERVTGQQTNGYAVPEQFAVHSIWPWDAHEAVHVYTAVWGRPSDFFNEGIAVALATDPTANRFISLWNNTPIDDIARNLKHAGTLPAMGVMVTTESFRVVSDQVSYPVAGSFVSFLLAQKGPAAMRAFFAASARGDSAATIESRFLQALGWTVADADAAWRSFLN